MSIEKMSLVQITGNIKSLDTVLLNCFNAGNFHPEQISKLSDQTTKGFTQISEENPYKSILSKMTEIAATAGIPLKSKYSQEDSMLGKDLDEFLTKFQDQLFALNEEKKALQEDIRRDETALTQLEHIDKLDFDLDDIFRCKYVQVRFGRLPHESYQKLNYYKDRMFICMSLSEEDGYNWCVYFTTTAYEAEIDDIFSALYFERIRISADIHGTPQSAMKAVAESLEKNKKKLKMATDAMAEIVQSNSHQFYRIYNRINFLNDSFEMRKYVGVYKKLFHIVGFIPTREEEKFAEHFKDIDDADVSFKPNDSDNRLVTPTKLRNNRLFQPFEMFVDMYGMPSYNEIDPTPFLAITYMLLFGIMFGDLGQGLAISLIGFLLWKLKKMDFGRILIRIGFSSALFGLLYGSVFGLEHLLDPFYTNVLGLEGKPIHIMSPATINQILIVAIALGVVLIITSMLMNVMLGFKNKNVEQALFSNNGVAGLVFYISTLVALIAKFTTGKNLFTPTYITFLIAVPLIVIFFKHPLGKIVKGDKHFMPSEGIGSFLIENFFEMFEVLLSFVTNSMSFLRVGGFIISHAGMMAVVITLTEMVAGSGSIAVMIFGNIFVMALEGFIVGIQVLRLEFYEMFSRYFEGQGKPFEAISGLSRKNNY